MIYPIGHSTLMLPIENAAGGGLLVDGVLVTDADGWLEVRLPDEAVAAGAPSAVSLRVRVERAPGNRWFFTAEQVSAGGRPFASLFELMTSGADAWLSGIGPALDREIERRLSARRAAR